MAKRRRSSCSPGADTLRCVATCCAALQHDGPGRPSLQTRRPRHAPAYCAGWDAVPPWLTATTSHAVLRCAGAPKPWHCSVVPHERSACASCCVNVPRMDEESFPRRRLPGGRQGAVCAGRAARGRRTRGRSSPTPSSRTRRACPHALAEAVVCLLARALYPNKRTPCHRVLTGYSQGTPAQSVIPPLFSIQSNTRPRVLA